jgi:hypothetical protein
MFGVSSRDQYLDRFVLPGKYHSLVPETVRKAYRTAEYLMAHAWYYWPMYDEALKKMTHIFEIAIKQKAKQLGIDLKQVTKKGKAQEKSLNTLIREIHKREPNRQILDSLLRAKNLRNTFAHPTHASFMGGIKASQDNIKYYINIINTLFLDYSLFVNYPKETSKLRSVQNSIESGLYRLTMGKSKFLVHRVLTWELYPSKSGPFLFTAFQIVTTETYKKISEGFVFEPIILGLKDTGITNESLHGVSLDNGEAVILESTDHPKNRAINQDYLGDLEKLDQEKFQQMGNAIAQQNAGWAIENLKYQHLWENYGVHKSGDSE